MHPVSMKYLGLCGCSLVVLVSGCSSAPSESAPIERVAQSAQALTDLDTVLGFESASAWHGVGALASSSEHSEGTSSLAVQPLGYTLYASDRFAFPGEVRSIALDIELPAPAPPFWAGAVQLYLDCPTRGVWNAYVGQVELTGLPRGTFTPLTFTLASALRAQLASGCEQMEVRLALNVPVSFPAQSYLLDNLRLRGPLQLHYSFDALTADGRVRDLSGYDRHGVLQGAAALGAGRKGSGLSLDGASGYLVIPDSLTEGIQELTVASWVKLDAQTGWSRLFDFGGSAGFAYFTPFTFDGTLRYSAYAGFGIEGTLTAPAIPAGPWKHVAVTTRGRDYRVYVDGVEAANALTVPTTPANIGVNNGGNWIGRSRFPDPLLDGTIDDFRVYDRVLSQAEIQALAAPGSDYANWRFDETTGAVAKDSSDLHLDGQISGTASHLPGAVNGALALDGVGGNVQLPTGLVQTCQDFTLTSWLKLRQNPPWNRVFDFGKPDFSSFMYLTPAGFGAAGQELHFGLITPIGIHDVGYPYVAPLGEWTHLGVVLHDQTATLFINGRAVTRQSGVTSNPSDMGATLGNYFGKSTFADPSFAGSFDDIRMSCRAFADSEVALLAHLPAPATLPNQLALSGDITDVHDPSMIATSAGYEVFSTGPGLLRRTSPDLLHWTFAGSVFAQNPAWVVEKFGNLDSLWAPDISFFNGSYHLYYAASSFGSNHSCIGHATKADLNSSDPWQDLGPVICSNDAGSVDDWNAIDPNVFVDASGTPWLSFGSFWGGLKLIQLDAAGARVGSSLVALATGPATAIEAPYLVYRAPYYYLFASHDFCCRGVNSTYHVVVGRSTSITGPYLDRTGLPMLQAGGTPVVNGDSRFVGPGHNAVVQSGGQWLNVYHSYDALNNGIPTLRISQLVWQEGWPVSAEP